MHPAPLPSRSSCRHGAQVRSVQDARAKIEGMTDLDSATVFIEREARLLERLRFAHAFQDGPAEPVLRALRAYANDDGGFGHALEPDLRAPDSQPTAVLTALEVMHEIGDASPAAAVCDFLAGIAFEDGGVPFALPSVLDHPHAPWYQPSETSSLTQTAGNVAGLLRLGVDHPFVTRATELCWQRIEHGTPDNSYDLLFAIQFLDAVPDEERAGAALDALGDVREALGEHTPLDVSPRPGSRSRRLFDADTIAAELDKLAGGQRDDGGWTFEWPAWNPAAAHEWRGIVTVQALTVLRANGRL